MDLNIFYLCERSDPVKIESLPWTEAILYPLLNKLNPKNPETIPAENQKWALLVDDANFCKIPIFIMF